MKEEKFSKSQIAREKRIADIKNFLGISQSQLVVSFIILLGVVIGSFAYAPKGANGRSGDILSQALAEQLLQNESDLKKSIVGSDTKGGNLYAADTKKEKKKKELEPVNINTASKLELMKLPGIGEKTADKIIEQRKIEPFSKPEDIQKVKGIGPKKFEKMKKYILV